MSIVQPDLNDRITEMINNTWNPKTNDNYAQDLSYLINNTLSTHWKDKKDELDANICNRLEIIDEYKKVSILLDYLRNWDKEDVMKKYNWSEYEAKYNKKMVFDKLEKRKKDLALKLGDIFEE